MAGAVLDQKQEQVSCLGGRFPVIEANTAASQSVPKQPQQTRIRRQSQDTDRGVLNWVGSVSALGQAPALSPITFNAREAGVFFVCFFFKMTCLILILTAKRNYYLEITYEYFCGLALSLMIMQLFLLQFTSAEENARFGERLIFQHSYVVFQFIRDFFFLPTNSLLVKYAIYFSFGERFLTSLPLALMYFSC